MIFKINIVAIILLIILKNCVFSQKIDISIYYESLCPDSVKFINNQLYPNWAKISPYVDLHFVPFGKSKFKTTQLDINVHKIVTNQLLQNINGGHDFECQHGPMECAGNKIQSCALRAVEDTNAQVQFVHCFMNSFAKSDVGQMCAAQVNLDWEQIEQCYNSPTGIYLQLQAEEKTKAVAPKFVPTITYNEIFNQEDQNDSQTNFIGVVCKHLNNIHPGICKKY